MCITDIFYMFFTIQQTSASISNDPKSSLRILTSSSAVHWEESCVNPTISAKRMLRKDAEVMMSELRVKRSKITLLTSNVVIKYALIMIRKYQDKWIYYIPMKYIMLAIQVISPIHLLYYSGRVFTWLNRVLGCIFCETCLSWCCCWWGRFSSHKPRDLAEYFLTTVPSQRNNDYLVTVYHRVIIQIIDIM